MPRPQERERKGFPTLRYESVIAFDPGATTGVCVVDRGNPLWTFSLKEEEVLEWAKSPPWELLPDTLKTLVVEEFRLFPGKTKAFTGGLFVPAQMIGAIRVLAVSLKVPIKFQQASLKALVTEEKLAFYNWSKVGKNIHEREAAKHALYYLTDKRISGETDTIPDNLSDLFKGGDG